MVKMEGFLKIIVSTSTNVGCQTIPSVRFLRFGDAQEFWEMHSYFKTH